MSLLSFDPPRAALPAPAPIRAIMLGCGVVGGGVLERLPASIRVEAILARSARRVGGDAIPVLTDPDAVLATQPDLVIEALPGGGVAEALLERAVAQGCHIVTANKDVAARRPDLARASAAQKRAFACSAAVGGGAPVLETVSRLTGSGAGLVRARGVLNGTSNFVLDRLAHGADLADAVAEAQRAGFAEADPSADLEGRDAACKLALIARAAWGLDLDPASIAAESISDLDPIAVQSASRLGQRVRQVASLVRTGSGVRADVRLETLASSDPLARARAEGNVVVLLPERGAEVIVTGKGAGRAPTAGSVIGDLTRLVQAVRS